jgi:O-antigen/teichoic acid export membrane protein
MKKTFISNLILVLALNLTIKPIWIFAFDRTVQSIVGPEEYGTYFSLLSFSFVFFVILDMGLTSFNNRNISQNTHLLSKHFSRMIILKLSLALVYLSVCCIIGLFIGYDFRHMKLLMLLCFMQFLISFIAYLRSNVSGLHLFKTDSMLSVTDRLIGIAICAPLIWFHVFGRPIDIMDYAYAQTIAYALTAAVAFAIVVAKAGFIKFQWNRTFSIMILKQSLPFAILTMLMAFYNRIDGVMLERILKDNGLAAGIYAQAFRLLDAVNMVAVLAAGLLLPMFSRMLKFKDSVEPLVRAAYTLLMLLAVVIACGCYFYGSQMMGVMYKADLDESSAVFKVLMCCFIGSVCQYIFGTLLTANGNLKQLNIIAGSAMAINILLNFVVIPMFHALGSAFASLTTQLFVATVQIIVVQRIFKFKMLPKLLLTLLVFLIGEIAIGYFASHLHIDWRISFACMLGASGIWALATGLLNLKSMLSVIKLG